MDDRINMVNSITQEEIDSVNELLGIINAPNEAEEINNEVNNLLDLVDGEFTEENTDATNTQETEEIIEESKSIRPNSQTLLINESTSRFDGAIWADKIRGLNITLAGLGGIGSWTGLLLSRLRPNLIRLYDDDTVDGTNMSGQLYGMPYIGTRKATALANIIKEYSGYYNIFSHVQRYNLISLSSHIMICGFDNMAARKIFYERWKNTAFNINNPKALFIDGRLAAEEFQVFCIKGDDEYHMKQYEDNWLFSDDEAESTVCSYKQTSHCANMIASVIVNLLVNFTANQCEPLIDRDVPFMTSYDSTTMYFKTVS